jgi:G3E family GTPase
MATPQPPTKKQRLDIASLLAPPTPLAPSKHEELPALLTADRTWAAAKKITSQMSTGAVPLTILTGFLGAGKSTILNYILKAPHKLRIAVLINEFGAIDIDSKLVDTSNAFQNDDPVVLDNGCICCTVSNGFIDAITRILDASAKSGSRPDYIIVETTGLANPKPIVDSIQETELREEIYVDQVLTAVDSSVWTSDHYSSPTAKQQIEAADTVLLTKTDLIQGDALLDTVIDSIISIRPNARILRSQAGYVPLAALFDLDIAAGVKENGNPDPERKIPSKAGEVTANGDSQWEDHKLDAGMEKRDIPKVHGIKIQESNLDGIVSNETHICSGSHDHKHGESCHHNHEAQQEKSHLEKEGFTSISFSCKDPLSLRRFRQDFMEGLPDGVFRAKGLLWFQNYESRFIFHWSGSRFNVDEGDWPDGVEKSNQLVVIGRDLDEGAITALLKSCMARLGEESESPEESDDDDDGASVDEDDAGATDTNASGAVP